MPIGLPDDEWIPHWERPSAARRAKGINETLQAVQKTIQDSSRFMSGDIVGAARKDLEAMGAVQKDLATMGGITSVVLKDLEAMGGMRSTHELVSDILGVHRTCADLLSVSSAIARKESFGGINAVTAASGSIQNTVETKGLLSIAQKGLLANAGSTISADKYSLAHTGMGPTHDHLLGAARSGADRVSEEIKRIETQMPKLKTDGLVANVFASSGVASTVEKFVADLGVMSLDKLTSPGLLHTSALLESQSIRSAGVASAIASIEGNIRAAGWASMDIRGLSPETIELATKAHHMGEVLEKIAASIVPDPLLIIRETESCRLLVVERLSKRWGQTQFWFLIRLLPHEDLDLLDGLEQEEMEEVLDKALEKVVTDGVFTQLLVSALDQATFITPLQRKDIRRGLALAEAGNFDDALPPFMLGLEGALWSTGEHKGIIDERRRLLSGPTKGKAESVEPVFKALPAAEGFSTFLLYRVFGGHGNHARHGRQSFSRRQHVLGLVVALAGWMDACMETPARQVLGLMLRDALSGEM